MRSARRARRRAVRAEALTLAMIATGGGGAKIVPAADGAAPTTFVRRDSLRSKRALAAPERHRLGEAAAFFRGLVGVQIGVVALQEAPPRGREATGGAVGRQPQEREQALGLLRERLPSFPDRTWRGRSPALGDTEPPAKIGDDPGIGRIVP